ncbi:PQQ-dependent sugar dehydrogenase [Roseivirga sp. BDSF3-8]|uniref:PQQ-dependent sugar dehydrogenase n=1 Tax=Roseivirga sp. BDSF3-8 TaxID=3241598 RepID=UPI003532413D
MIKLKITGYHPVIFLFPLLLLSPLLKGADLPAGFVETRVAKDLDPTGITAAPDGRIFIAQKDGRITIVKDGMHLSTPFLTLDVDNFNERGLMSIAFDPDFENNSYVYVFYTVPESANEEVHNRVSRFTANGDTADPASEQVLYDFHRVSAGIHNGGALFFRDGYLFASHGDNAYGPNSQTLLSNLGKLIRINPDGSIPADNPFYNETTGELRAIYALGFRNPFKGGVDPQTGKIFLNDVGQAAYEEVNEVVPGGNYGWPYVEGPIAGQTPPDNYQDPVYAYGRTEGCSITVGGFYNPVSSPYPSEWQGKYFFGDYCANYIKALDPQTGQLTTFGTGFKRPLDVAVDDEGILYVLVRQGLGGGSQQDNTSSSDGELWRMDYTGSTAPVITVQPESVTTNAGNDVLFTVAASGSSLQYQWLRDGANIAGATSSSYLLEDVSVADDSAAFRVFVYNSVDTVVSDVALLRINSNTPPTLAIDSPDSTLLYQAGQTITFSGTATDAEDGPLPDSAYTWWIDFHHDSHTHPALDETSGITSGSLTISRTNETSDNVWYRIYLRATDSDGASVVTYREIYPQKADITLATDPPGLELLLDGKADTTPYTVTGVVGITRTVEAPQQQALNGVNYVFDSWSDGGAATHDITTPETNTVYTALYVVDTTAQDSLRIPEDPANTVNGLDYAYYEQTWYSQPDFSAYIPADTGTTAVPDLALRQREDYFGMQYTGYVEVPADGEYTFYTASDDGSVLYIGDSLVVDNGGLHALQERSGRIGLQAGKHAVRIEYFEKTGGQTLTVSYDGPGQPKGEIPASAWYRVSADTTGPAPGPDPDPVNLLLEAEEATVFGANILQWIPRYTGSGYVDYSGQYDDYIEWVANVPDSGEYTLQFRYVLGASASRPLELRINDMVTDPAQDFPVTAGWNDWQVVETTVTLPAGQNTIRTTAIGYSGGNIDHLRVYNDAGAPAARTSLQSSVKKLKRSVEVFPVPADASLTLSGIEGAKGARMVDATGRTVWQTEAEPAGVLRLNTSGFDSGLYLLIVEMSGSTVRKRIVIKH